LIHETTNVSAKHTILATPNKIVGVLDLGIEIGAFLDTTPEVNNPMGLGMMFVNTNHCGSHTWH
jgi:hypothetical protein